MWPHPGSKRRRRALLRRRPLAFGSLFAAGTQVRDYLGTRAALPARTTLLTTLAIVVGQGGLPSLGGVYRYLDLVRAPPLVRRHRGPSLDNRIRDRGG